MHDAGAARQRVFLCCHSPVNGQAASNKKKYGFLAVIGIPARISLTLSSSNKANLDLDVQSLNHNRSYKLACSGLMSWDF